MSDKHAIERQYLYSAVANITLEDVEEKRKIFFGFPANTVITGISVIIKEPFDGGAKLAIGYDQPGKESELSPATALSSNVILANTFFPQYPKLVATLSGGPAAKGEGHIAISYYVIGRGNTVYGG